MLKRIIFCVVIIFISNMSWSDDPMNPTSFTHQTRKSEYQIYPELQIKLSIARVNDNQLLETPFGKVIGGTEINISNSQTTTVKTPKSYDISKDEYGYGKKIRELLSYNLSSIKCFQLIEREEINNIVREWDFEDTKYIVKKEGKSPAIEMPKYIAKGFLTDNYGGCENENDNEEDAWGIENKKDKNNLKFLIRLYSTETTQVRYIACGTGNTIEEAVNKSVKDIKKHRDLFFPSVKVISYKDKNIQLDGGTTKGLTPGIKFYLIRTEVGKEYIPLEDYDSLEYVALCQITKSDNNSSSAVVKKVLSKSEPKSGDVVFYYFREEEWY